MVDSLCGCVCVVACSLEDNILSSSRANVKLSTATLVNKNINVNTTPQHLLKKTRVEYSRWSQSMLHAKIWICKEVLAVLKERAPDPIDQKFNARVYYEVFGICW